MFIWNVVVRLVTQQPHVPPFCCRRRFTLLAYTHSNDALVVEELILQASAPRTLFNALLEQLHLLVAAYLICLHHVSPRTVELQRALHTLGPRSSLGRLAREIWVRLLNWGRYIRRFGARRCDVRCKRAQALLDARCLAEQQRVKSSRLFVNARRRGRRARTWTPWGDLCLSFWRHLRSTWRWGARWRWRRRPHLGRRWSTLCVRARWRRRLCR